MPRSSSWLRAFTRRRAGAVAELAALRSHLAGALRAMRLCAASAGTYPLPSPGESRVSGSERYRVVADSMRALARREPTLALHVHVGIPDPEDAIRVLNGLRGAVPILLALSANSPFSQGRDTGFASARTVIFQGFPRTGTARLLRRLCRLRRSGGWVDCVGGAAGSELFVVGRALAAGVGDGRGSGDGRAIDSRGQRGSDRAGSVAGAPRAAGRSRATTRSGPEILAENRFLAARDGLDARLIDPVKRRLVPVRDLVSDTMKRCRPHAAALGCSVELERITALAAANGADRQRAQAAGAGLVELVSTLSEHFAAPSEPSV